MGRLVSKKAMRKVKRRSREAYNYKAFLNVDTKTTHILNDAIQLPVVNCVHCYTCLICHRELHGNKLHSGKCNYECGMSPALDVFGECKS